MKYNTISEIITLIAYKIKMLLDNNLSNLLIIKIYEINTIYVIFKFNKKKYKLTLVIKTFLTQNQIDKTIDNLLTKVDNIVNN